jgi:ribonucleotide reductase beta subunit family protein with ferritin-like domain
MSTKEKQAQLAEILKAWQHVENRSVVQTAEIIDKTTNPVIRIVMEIIQRDSAMHHRVQQFIIDSLENQAIQITPDDIAQVWSAIEAHIESERRTGELVVAAQKALAGTRNVVQQYLLSYLGHDEKKHDQLLDDLALIKRGMYKSA